MMPFGALIRIPDGKQRIIEVSETRIRELLGFVAAHIVVDQDWYLEVYRDVFEAVQCGVSASAKDHYVHYGYFEDRLPRHFKVDADWYLAQYPDVADAISSGAVGSPQHHFERDGFREGRRAYSDWTL
jgi:hypothetical protein